MDVKAPSLQDLILEWVRGKYDVRNVYWEGGLGFIAIAMQIEYHEVGLEFTGNVVSCNACCDAANFTNEKGPIKLNAADPEFFEKLKAVIDRLIKGPNGR